MEKTQVKVMNELKLPDYIWKTVQDGMFLVTQGKGTAANTFGSFPYKIAAKTGTSDQDIYIPIKNNNKKTLSYSKYGTVANGVFIAYGPVENPKLAISVIVPQGDMVDFPVEELLKKIFEIYDKYYGLEWKLE